MTRLIIIIILLGTVFSSCSDDCVTCTGPTAPRKYCPDDYQFKSDFQSDVQAYQDAGGECE